MKNYIKILIACVVVVGLTFAFKSVDNKKNKPGPEGTNLWYSILYDTETATLRITDMANGNVSSDSLIVHANTPNYTRRIAPLNEWLAGYTPTSRTLTINGTTLDLSANRSWTVGSYSAGTGLNLVGTTFNNTAPDQVVSLIGGNRIQITGTYPNFTISYVEPSINQVSRNVNTNYTIGTKQANVFYSVPVTATNPLLAGTSVGTAYLEYSTNAGSTWTTALPTSASSSVGLSVTVALTTGGNNMLCGVIPANALVRIRTVISGTATVSNATGQEVY